MPVTRHIPAGEPLRQGLSAALDGTPVDLPRCRVSAVPYNTPWPGRQRPLDQTEEAAFLGFESDSPVTLSLQWERPIREVIVRPLSRKIRVLRDTDECKAAMLLPHPGAYVVEADGHHGALHVFFDPVKDFESAIQNKTRVITFGPGLHDVGCVDLHSNTTVFLHRDAWIRGSFRAVCAENIDILGYGVIDGSRQKRRNDTPLFPEDLHATIPRDRTDFLRMLRERKVLDGLLRFYRCRNVRVEGPVLLDSPTFAVVAAGSEDVSLKNLKTVGMWRYNSGGIAIFNSRRVHVAGCFLRDFDDCIALKGIAGWDDEDMHQITVGDCVAWCDWGRNLKIGAETNADSFRDIVFRNIDNIHGSAVFMDIQSHNRANIGKVLFENIRTEYSRRQLREVFQTNMTAPYPTSAPYRHPLLICLSLLNSGLYSTHYRHGTIHDVTFRKISVLTDAPMLPPPRCKITGLDAKHAVSHIVIQGVTQNGHPLSTPQTLPIRINAAVRDVTVMP